MAGSPQRTMAQRHAAKHPRQLSAHSAMTTAYREVYRSWQRLRRLPRLRTWNAHARISPISTIA